MGFFKDISMPLVSKGVPVIPLRPKTKIAFMTGWEALASTDPKQIEKWDEEFANANNACVALANPDGIWFLEIDRADYAKKIEEETGQKMPQTFMVRSSPGRGHFYFKQTPASIMMGNRQASDDRGETWSARVDNRYVVGPGSFHPTSGKQYEILRDVPIIEAPDWLVVWCSNQPKRELLGTGKTGDTELDNETPIIEGNRNNALTSILGRARQVLRMDREQLHIYGQSVNQKRCRPPMSDGEVKTIAYSVGSYAIAPTGPETVIVGGIPGGIASQQQALVVPILLERPDIPLLVYPVWPKWVMKGTSLYDGLIEPTCAVNSRYPEFMFMPGVVLMLNYLALKVQIKNKKIIPSFWMVSIGRKGRTLKSSSVNDAVDYLQTAGVVASGGGSTRNAEGKTLIWTAGSTEGLGMEMFRTNCKNAVLFYDELGTLTSKAGIENSSMKKHLLTMYESGQFANTVKSRKESFDFAAGTYCASIIACTTDKNFHTLWSKIGGQNDGMDDRFFFLHQPERLEELKPYTYVNTVEATVETRKRIDKAVQQAVYTITDSTPLESKINKLGNRVENRAEKLALYFAVDLGRDEIDEECIERALAICEYELVAKEYLQATESLTQEGALQNEIIQLLRRNAGVMGYRDMSKVMHPERMGTTLWYKVYAGLVRSGWIAEEGKGTRGEPKTIILMQQPEKDDEN